MINKILPRGKMIGGLVRYLFGKGEANEHRDQRVIAADDVLELPDGTRLDRPEHRERIALLARDLDAHRKLAGTAPASGWVWHCAVSLPPGERLSDATWAEAARTIIDRLSFGGDDASGRAPCRWIAVHHGPSAEGNDHIHLAVNLVREDGTVANPGLDRKAMSRICGELEKHFGLSVVEGRADGGGLSSIARAEAERAQREGRVEADSRTLARHVRRAAGLAADEAEFVRSLRQAGVLLNPRFSKERDRVVGYSVALQPVEGGKGPVWFGGGRLGADLTLPKLRQTWTGRGPADDEARTLAVWRTQDRIEPEEPPTYRAATWDRAAQIVEEVAGALVAVPADDVAVWSTAAREGAAVYAALSIRLEVRKRGLLATTSDVLASYAQTRSDRPRVSHAHGLGRMRGVVKVAATAGRGSGEDGWLKVFRSLLKLLLAVEEARRARMRAERAVQRLAETQSRLARIIAVHEAQLARQRRAPDLGLPAPRSARAPGLGYGRTGGFGL